ncbi:MAG: arginyltransferase, partial [Gammaproteobacteria bacterium]|nr:arginyltransferase [Gammaproteobacteria bacterium]
RLLAVAVVDYMTNGLSAVYTFFDPDEDKRSLGTHAILQQIWLARLYNLPHLYLGYWIQEHPKMDYKGKFNALEILHKMRWCRADSDLK